MWRIELEGAEVDIDDIARALPDGVPYRVAASGEQSYLEGEKFPNDAGAHAVLLRAQKVLEILNVAAQLSDDGHRSVRAGAVVDPLGQRHIFAEAETGLARARGFAAGVVTTPDGSPPPPRIRTLGELMLDLEDAPELGEVVGLLAGECPPADQYKILEIIRDHVDGRLEKKPWVNEADLKRFTHSVNDQKVLGSSRCSR
jgi:hypothetical protein